MLKTAAKQMNSFKYQKLEAAERLATAQEKLHNAFARINVLEIRGDEFKEEVEDRTRTRTCHRHSRVGVYR